VDIALLMTGNELMRGDTVDSNSAMIAQLLAPRGFDIACKVTVGDDIAQLLAALQLLSQRYPVVIINGGLGPTEDDLTAQALSAFSSCPLQQDAEALAHVQRWCAARGIAANAANLKQSWLPETAQLIDNPVGSAVGIQLRHGDCLLLAAPGVPSELRSMLRGELGTCLTAGFPQAEARLIRRLRVFGIGESRLQQQLQDRHADWPAAVKLGFRAGVPLLEVKLEVGNKADLAQRDQCEQWLRLLLGERLIGESDDTLATVVVDLLRQQKRCVTLAESCTGGMMASELTAVAGASTVFEAGFVTYADSVKRQILSVDGALLAQHGAVSREVVLAMARGALEASTADCVVAVSGIAGPSGGSEEKPVGTVWLAWGGRDNLQAKAFFCPAGRRFFQAIVTAIGLDLLRRYLLGSERLPGYFQRPDRAD